jgi:hypothetical protein
MKIAAKVSTLGRCDVDDHAQLPTPWSNTTRLTSAD